MLDCRWREFPSFAMSAVAAAQMKEKFQIWLVEDTEADELLVRQALKMDGMNCDFQVLEDGEKAIDFVDALDGSESRIRPHIILLDLNLPRKGERGYSSGSGRVRNAVVCQW